MYTVYLYMHSFEQLLQVNYNRLLV